MPGQRPNDGTKKTRWSTAQKAEARTVKKARNARRTDADPRPPRREDRRDDVREDRRPRDGYRSRPDAERGERGHAPRARADEGRPFGRDDRGARSGRPSFDRTDRGARGPVDRDRDRPQRRPFERDDRRPYGRDDRGERRPYDRDDRRPSRDDRGERRPYQQRDDRGERRPYQQRDDRGERRPYQQRDDRGERRPYQQRDDRGERRPYQQRDDRGERRPYQRDDRGERRPFDRDDRGDRPARRPFERDERPTRDARAEGEGRRSAERHTRLFENTPTTHTRPERPERHAAPVTEDNGFAKLGVPMPLVERLARDGITEPFPIQTATLPDALAGRDVLGRGRTGSGKTLAFGLAALARLAGGTARPNRPRAVVLVPTRELAMQVSDALQPLVHVLGLRHKLVAGGMPYPPQFDALERGLDILIATPGRLNDLVDRGAAILDGVEIAILDEADHMADMGFMPEVTALLDLIPAGGQRLLFSATLDNGIDELVERYLVDPVTHSTDEARASVTTMAHHVLLIEPQHKKVITAEVANRDGRTVVFVRTKLGADRVAMQLREQGVFAAALHGGLNQGARNRVLAAFKDGTLPVLVATDVAARGIHVDDVSVVLQVDPPADHKDYLHRAGRTARAGEEGTVVTLALPHQKKMMERIGRDAGLTVEPVRVRPGDDTILAATGARPTSGEAIPEERLRRLLDPPRRPVGRGRRFGGGSGPRRDGGHRGSGGYGGRDRRRDG
ncbi:DEAD/DEAH box helicase [Agilicoccus flavus]|uniref:DEAD/DEAH box helicase n=1 Tax=Agilicoccus flavus TaxID=2775968 RepID=UPI001CF6F790|nr:DEAD/DEAH box helicase [Agilicoccus flavus]